MSNVLRAVVLKDYPFLWCWEIEDTSGRLVESSWNDRWDAFATEAEAIREGFTRLDARARPDGARATAPTPAQRILVIVGRGDDALYERLIALFRGHTFARVIRDRRSGERRRRHERRAHAVDRRRQDDRRRHPVVDAQIRALGWSAVLGSPRTAGDRVGRDSAAMPALA